MARPKQVPKEERKTVEITYTVVPWFAVTVDDPKLRGYIGVGPTPKAAITNLRSQVRRIYPHHQYDIVEHE